MPRRPALLAAVVLIIASALVWRWGCSEPSKKDEATVAASSSPRIDRARRDWKDMAWALSDIATRPLGTVRVSGRVHDLRNDAPIPNAEVIFSGMGGESSTSTDDSGRYELELKPGLYRSYAQAEGYVAVSHRAAQRLPEAAQMEDIAVPKTEMAPLAGLLRDHNRLDLSLVPSATVRGRVEDQRGNAIAGAVVYLNSSYEVIGGSHISESDEDGHYELQVPAGVGLLGAHHNEFAGSPGFHRRQLAPGDEWDQDLVLAEGCIIEGMVVDGDDALVLTGAFERFINATDSTPVGKIREGRVRYTQLHPGLVKLRAWPWGHPPSESLEFECAEGRHFRGELFRVPDANPVLTGTVEDVSGNAIPLGFVDLFPLEPGGMAQQERADHNGEFRFHDLPDGPVQISVHHPSRGVGLMVVDVPSSGVRIELSGTGSVSGELERTIDATLTLEYRCEMRLSEDEAARGDELSMPTQTRLVAVERGRFHIDGLPACPVRGAMRGGDVFTRFEVEVLADQEIYVKL